MKISKRVENLLARMTMEEKAGQLTQLSGIYFVSDTRAEDITGPLSELQLEEAAINTAGSVLSVFDMEDIHRIQKEHMQKDPHKIPMLFMADIIHGYKTIFPIPLALSCSWNAEIVEETAAVSALEASLGGQHVTFSPMADLVRDSRWGRVMEATGEDPYLNALYARAFVRGYQGKDVKEYGRIAACVKHFIGYGQGEAGREYNTVDLSEGILREFCLPSFQAALDEGCLLVMSSFNTLFRVPVTGSRRVLKGMLREEMEFEGVVISDWGAVNELINHSIAAGSREACQAAFQATVDIEMMSAHYINNIPALIEDSVITREELDEAAARVLTLKEQLGLFENPYKDLNQEKATETFLCPAHREKALEAARESIVLLKNRENTLPISRKSKVAIVGPFAQSREMLGGWHTLGENKDCISLFEGMEHESKAEEICTADWIEGQTEQSVENALAVCRNADYVIVTMGESQDDTGESTSRASLSMECSQQLLLEKVKKLGKKVISVVFSGRALELAAVQENSDALIQAWYLGVESGNALAQIIYGDYEPVGRLTISFPHATGQMPLYYNAYQTGRPKISDDNEEKYVSKYIDCPNAPLYPFGFGLGYTEFTYSDIRLSQRKMAEGEVLEVSVTLQNIGHRAGTETVQMYLRDISASVVRPVLELKDFRKVFLQPGESRCLSFIINREMLSFLDEDMNRVVEAGEFEVMLGANSRDWLVDKFSYIRRDK